MSKDYVELLRRVVNERGYFVGGYPAPLKIGETIDHIDFWDAGVRHGVHLPQPFAAVLETTEEDFQEQAISFGGGPALLRYKHKFYRFMTD